MSSFRIFLFIFLFSPQLFGFDFYEWALEHMIRTHGAEFTWTNKEMAKIKNYESSSPSATVFEWRKRFADKVEEKCLSLPGCSKSYHKGPHNREYVRFTLDNGLWVQIEADPGCIEVITSPLSFFELYHRRDYLKYLLFNTAEEMGLTTQGMGNHHNFGFATSFASGPGHLLRFHEFIHNRPELGIGMFYNHPFIAPFYSNFSRKKENPSDEFNKVIQRYYSGEFESALDLARAINNDVNSIRWPLLPKSQGSSHNSAIGLKSVTGKWKGRNWFGEPSDPHKQVAELRFLAMSPTVEHYLLSLAFWEMIIEETSKEEVERLVHWPIKTSSEEAFRLRFQNMWVLLKDMGRPDFYDDFSEILAKPDDPSSRGHYPIFLKNTPLNEISLRELQYWGPRVFVSKTIRTGVMNHLNIMNAFEDIQSHIALIESFANQWAKEPLFLQDQKTELRNMIYTIAASIESSQRRNEFYRELRRHKNRAVRRFISQNLIDVREEYGTYRSLFESYLEEFERVVSPQSEVEETNLCEARFL